MVLLVLDHYIRHCSGDFSTQQSKRADGTWAIPELEPWAYVYSVYFDATEVVFFIHFPALEPRIRNEGWPGEETTYVWTFVQVPVRRLELLGTDYTFNVAREKLIWKKWLLLLALLIVQRHTEELVSHLKDIATVTFC